MASRPLSAGFNRVLNTILRAEHGKPAVHHVARQALLGKRRHVGRSGQALAAGGADDAQRTRLDVLLRRHQAQHAEIDLAAAFDAPDVKEAMAKQGNVIQIGTPEQALATFKAEGARFAALVKKAGVTPQ